MQKTNILSPPVGSIIQTSNSATPVGYIKCNGAELDRTTYASLFSAIGTTYGTGNGSTTFNVPDYRGCFLRGLDESRGLDAGRAIGSYQADSLQPHAHSWYSWTTWAYGWNQSPNYNQNSVTTGATGGAETRPKNYSVMYWIKY